MQSNTLLLSDVSQDVGLLVASLNRIMEGDGLLGGRALYYKDQIITELKDGGESYFLRGIEMHQQIQKKQEFSLLLTFFRNADCDVDDSKKVYHGADAT